MSDDFGLRSPNHRQRDGYAMRSTRATHVIQNVASDDLSAQTPSDKLDIDGHWIRSASTLVAVASAGTSNRGANS